MNISKDYDNLIIAPLEHEIKYLKKRINKKFNLNKEFDKQYLSKLQEILNNYYKKYYELTK